MDPTTPPPPAKTASRGRTFWLRRLTIVPAVAVKMMATKDVP